MRCREACFAESQHSAQLFTRVAHRISHTASTPCAGCIPGPQHDVKSSQPVRFRSPTSYHSYLFACIHWQRCMDTSAGAPPGYALQRSVFSAFAAHHAPLFRFSCLCTAMHGTACARPTTFAFTLLLLWIQCVCSRGIAAIVLSHGVSVCDVIYVIHSGTCSAPLLLFNGILATFRHQPHFIVVEHFSKFTISSGEPLLVV
jgi:hypothetical protein